MFFRRFLLLYKTENSQTPKGSLWPFGALGLKVITMGSGMEGKTISKPLLRVKFSSSPPTWGPSMGLREEVNRSVALKLASFTPIIDTVMACFMLLSWRQPGRARAQDDKWWCIMEKPRGWWGQETTMHWERRPPPQDGPAASLAHGRRDRQQMACQGWWGSERPARGTKASNSGRCSTTAQSTYLVHSSWGGRGLEEGREGRRGVGGVGRGGEG